ncbi:NAD(P)/FAD-dependent oxidoreductase [Heliobacterium chlorum]|uniref:NAD(P)/FAD-dependent oxidoreductase n=1 Tax=Heliobacterium chlorum TaxID=2698 RepID=A0ABR7SX93_HELCL|nr:NAD(P)/FAD-dependent oxidoreductase [Heliobacterium chlorum]MBC9783076.1 NAD(P)/FAD-dependent oxidoreductase [Heliobacterium chlorum]
MGDKILIIGGGLAGLATGCYGQMNDYKTKIYEMHFIPGGCCTAWKRKGYVFDQCIDWMLGAKPGIDMYQLWEELHGLKGKNVRFFEDEFNCVVNEKGEKVIFYTDPDKLEKHLKKISPEDQDIIEEFCDGVRLYARSPNFPFLKPEPLWTIWDKVKYNIGLLPYIKSILKYAVDPIESFANRFKSPLLRAAFPFIFQQKNPDFMVLPYLYNLGAMHAKNACYPDGGSLELAKSVEQRYKDLGGEILYKKRVTKVLVERDKAVGVQFEDGTTEHADIVVSTIDGRTTIYDLLGGQYVDKDITMLYDALLNNDTNKVKIYHGFYLLFLGINRDLSDVPSSTTYLLEDGSQLFGGYQNSFCVRHFCHHEPNFAPKGKSVIEVFYYSDYDCWKTLYDSDRESYNEKKTKVANFIIDFLEKQYPGLKGQIEAIDTSTPVTAERYTGNYQGTVMAWSPFGDTEDHVKPLIDKLHMQLPGLKNFYMAGHWLSTGALIRAVSSGRYVMQFICKNEGKKFKVIK